MERVGGVGAACAVGESPTWSAAESAWYWVDIPAKRVWRLDGRTGATRRWSTDEMVACVAARADGGLIAGMETGIFSLDLGDESANEAADKSVDESPDEAAAVQTRLAAPVSGLGQGMRFNDGRCDRQGRFWSGTMFMDMAAARAVGRLYRYDGRGISAPVVSELLTQNGLAFSPDGRTMYLSDSHPARRLVWAFDYDTADGVPSGRRVFADLNAQAGRPDGAAVDSDGCYWICANDGGCVLRYTPDGKLDRRLDVPMLKPSMCAFGGDDLRTLMVTSIVSGKPEDAQWGGAVLLLNPGAQGVAETPFGIQA